MTDLELIDYAEKAGLCLPTCWDLAQVYDENEIKETEEWVSNSQTLDERQEKQAVANTMKLRAYEKMKNLRDFAELILAHEKNRK